jgi:hypothetical protein
MRYAVIKDGRVVNVVVWDGVSDWQPGDDVTVIDCPDDVGPGWTHSDEGFAPPPPPPEPDVEDPA